MINMVIVVSSVLVLSCLKQTRTMTNVNQAPLPRLSKAPLVRASLVKRRYIKYLALPFFTQTDAAKRFTLATVIGMSGDSSSLFYRQLLV